MKKKITALALALCIAFCLVSCNKIEQNVNVNTYDEQVNATVSQENNENIYSGSESEQTTQQATKNQTIAPNATPQTQKKTTTTQKKIATTTKAAHTHSFSSANCTQPQKCSCGATLGSALGHSYSSATCTSPKKCSRCGVTSGSALGHNYQNDKCTRCGKTDPDSLPVGLHELHVIDSGFGYQYYKGSLKDSFGNSYIGYHRLWEGIDGTYVIFNLDNKYSRFICDVVVNSTMPSESNGAIQIYVDDDLVFQKSGITKTTGKVHVDVNVKGGQTLKIVATDNYLNYNEVLCLVNAQVKK